MNETYFVDDTIPRRLYDFLEKNYTIWIIIREQEDTLRWNSVIVPDMLRENIVLLEDFDISKLIFIADQDTSFVLTNNPENKSLYNICGPVYNINDMFNLKFPIITFVDYLFCFGFTEEQFYSFCENLNFIGVAKNKTVHDRDSKNKTNGIAFWVDASKLWKQQKEDFTEFVSICIQKKLFVPINQNTMLGITYQGKDKQNYIDSNLPLLYV